MRLQCSETLVSDRGYSQTLRRIRGALDEAGLQIAFDVDIGASICRFTGVQLAKSALLGVACPYQLLEACVADPAAAVFLPLHVIVAERGDETEVRLLAPEALRAAGLTMAITIPVHRTLRRVMDALGVAGAHRVEEGQRLVMPPDEGRKQR